MNSQKKDYARLQALLEEQETFPLEFTYKFIGNDTPAFAASIAAFERSHSTLRPAGTRRNGAKHVAMTYQFTAPSAAVIIEIYRAIEKIEDIIIVL